MAGGNFLGRVISYVVNELVVEGLANNTSPSDGIRFDHVTKSPSFQRFAVRTSRAVEEMSNRAKQVREEIAERVKDASEKFDPSRKQ